jgi:hypothetical protein
LRQRNARLTQAEFETRRIIERWERHGSVPSAKQLAATIEPAPATLEQAFDIQRD